MSNSTGSTRSSAATGSSTPTTSGSTSGSTSSHGSTSSPCLDIQKGKLKEEYQTWGEVYSVEFDIVVNQLPPKGSLNVFVFILTNGLGRIPSLNVKHDGQFVI